MEETTEVIPETLNQDAETGVTAETSSEEVDAQLKKANEYAQNQKIRAEKAELRLKALEKNKVGEVKVEPITSKPEYSLQDIRALADVHDDDVPKIEKLAKLEGISIAEAKKSSLGQSILRDSIENRKSAEATNVGVSKRGVSKVSDDAVLEEVAQGKLPDTDEGIARLTAARMAMKLKK